MKIEKIPIILGTTATGKTAVAIELAKRVDGELINADARAIYRGMDIGTAKPSAEEQAQVPHHLIDICDPAEIYDVEKFHHDVEESIKDIQSRGKVPIIVGGSTLYIKAITEGVFEGPGADAELRQQFDETPLEMLYQQLTEVDPVTALRLKPKDRIRITRALEVFELTGQSISKWQAKAKPLAFTFQKFGLWLDRAKLYERINQRVDVMMDMGLLEEARALHPKLKPGTPAYKTIGYQELFDHFEGTLSLEDAIDKIKQHTRNYAKRQLTWHRRDETITWIDVEKHSSEAIVDMIIDDLKK